MARTIDIPREFVIESGISNAQTAIGDGLYNGQPYYQLGGVSQGFRFVLWIWNGTLEAWQAVPISPIQGTGNPNGIVTPDAINQSFIDSVTGNFYVATGVTNNDWTLTN